MVLLHHLSAACSPSPDERTGQEGSGPPDPPAAFPGDC